jgi:hypothetical protein
MVCKFASASSDSVLCRHHSVGGIAHLCAHFVPSIKDPVGCMCFYTKLGLVEQICKKVCFNQPRVRSLRTGTMCAGINLEARAAIIYFFRVDFHAVALCCDPTSNAGISLSIVDRQGHMYTNASVLFLEGWDFKKNGTKVQRLFRRFVHLLQKPYSPSLVHMLRVPLTR